MTIKLNNQGGELGNKLGEEQGTIEKKAIEQYLKDNVIIASVKSTVSLWALAQSHHREEYKKAIKRELMKRLTSALSKNVTFIEREYAGTMEITAQIRVFKPDDKPEETINN